MTRRLRLTSSTFCQSMILMSITSGGVYNSAEHASRFGVVKTPGWRQTMTCQPPNSLQRQAGSAPRRHEVVAPVLESCAKPCGWRCAGCPTRPLFVATANEDDVGHNGGKCQTEVYRNSNLRFAHSSQQSRQHLQVSHCHKNEVDRRQRHAQSVQSLGQLSKLRRRDVASQARHIESWKIKREINEHFQ